MKVILLFVILVSGVFCARQESKDVCLQPMKTGPCEAAFRRYFYNYETKKCDIFIYGGCQSNGNNFKSKEECRRACIPNL